MLTAALVVRRVVFLSRQSTRALSSINADAVIIGSGIIGCSLATELSRHGFRTINIDSNAQSGDGSTGYSSGICRMMYSIVDSVKFAWEGFSYYENWADHIGVKDEAGLARLQMCGGIVPRTPAAETYLSRVIESYDAVGLGYEFMDAKQMKDRFPMLDLTSFAPPKRIDSDLFGEPSGRIESGVYFPKTGYVSDPQLAARNLQTAAEHTGLATFRFGETVTSIRRTGGRVSGVSLSDGTHVAAPIVVNAAGPHSSLVTRLAFPDDEENDMRLRTRPMRQEVATVSHPKPSPECDHWASPLPLVSDMDAGVYFRPDFGTGKIVIGSLEPECDEPHHIYPEDPASVRPGAPLSNLTDQWTNQVYRAALRMPSLPLPDSSNTQGIVACYDVTDDWTPIYDKSSLPGYYMAIGTSGNQFKNAGVAGRLMREIIEATEAGVDLDRNPLAFELKRIPAGGSLNAGTFSRLRSNLQTSGTVMG